MSNADILVSALVRELSNFYNSTAFGVFKFIIGIYVIVLVIDLVLLLFQRGLGEDLRITLLGSDVPKELIALKSNLTKNWKKIKNDLEGEDEDRYKVAIIKADAIIEDMLRKLKYSGENFTEILANIPPGQVEHLEDIKKAHDIRNKIVLDENFKVDKKMAQETLALYEKFLEFFGITN